ncbi:MAG: glycoside hydrolase family 13 protein [Firmicutes bacterium]|nr:glycoside hydrolase family 13 protein [Bacillota bacterium]
MIQREAVWHQPHGAYCYPVRETELLVTLRARKGNLQSCRVFFGDRYLSWDMKSGVATREMALAESDELFDYFQATLELDTRRFRYLFHLDDGREQLWYGPSGFATGKERAGTFEFPYLSPREIFLAPEWARDAIFYQIFLERFYNGDPANDPPGVLPWGGRPTSKTFFGGDLAGIMEKFPYLNELGINALYLTPIFKAPSTHKYDTTDYYQVDPAFGDTRTLRRLVDECHARGIRVVLDGVFNHSGYDFFAFKDVREKGRASRYVEWFNIYGFPVETEPECNYETFFHNIAAMPKLNTRNPEVQAYLINVARHWLTEVGIDGWRLDVANEVDHRFWRAFREAVKAVKPDALLVGEILHEATEFLRGDEWDAVMNYLFRGLVVDFFARREIGAARFDQELAGLRMKYPRQAQDVLWNLIGSHDTERFLTLSNGDVDALKLAATFQMTYVGAPMIYYGDEVGMEGGPDPDCRRPMLWEEGRQNRELLAYYKKLIQARREVSALRRGSYRTVAAYDELGVFGFERRDGSSAAVVLFNNSAVDQWVALHGLTRPLSGRLTDRLSGNVCEAAGGDCLVFLPRMSAAMFTGGA